MGQERDARLVGDMGLGRGERLGSVERLGTVEGLGSVERLGSVEGLERGERCGEKREAGEVEWRATAEDTCFFREEMTVELWQSLKEVTGFLFGNSSQLSEFGESFIFVRFNAASRLMFSAVRGSSKIPSSASLGAVFSISTMNRSVEL